MTSPTPDLDLDLDLDASGPQPQQAPPPQPWPFPRADALPPYAFVTTDAAKAKVVAAGANLIDLGLGNPDRPTPREIVEVLHASADIGKNHRYHPGRGLLELRQAFAA